MISLLIASVLLNLYLALKLRDRRESAQVVVQTTLKDLDHDRIVRLPFVDPTWELQDYEVTLSPDTGLPTVTYNYLKPVSTL